MSDIKKILLVDDEPFILLTVSSCLASANYEVIKCNNVHDASEKFKEETFDLVISDIAMTPLDGFEFRTYIRSVSSRMPILFLTSMYAGNDMTLFDKINDDEYSYFCNKNFVRDNFLKKVQSIITKYDNYRAMTGFKKTMSDNLMTAEKIQRMLLPYRIHETEDCYYNYVYKAAFHVSGDLVKWIELKDSCYVGVFGDISGHGVQAALIMSSIQALLTDEHINQDVTPDVILQTLHDFFKLGFIGQIYMTCLVAIWNFKENKLCFQSAGHPDLLCFNSISGEDKKLNPNNIGNMPIGLFKDTIYTAKENIEYNFDDNDVFFAYTDGLFDLTSETDSNRELNYEFFSESVKIAIKQNSILGVPHQIIDSCMKIGLDKQIDDLLLFAIKKKNQNEHIFTTKEVHVDFKVVDDMCSEISNFIFNDTNDLPLSSCIEILLSEFLTNIVKHGSNDNKLYISVVMAMNDEKVINIEIYDNSLNWRANKFNSSESNDMFNKLIDDMQTGGRGIPIINTIAQNIYNAHCCGLNKTIFTVNRDIANKIKNMGQ